MIVNTDEAEYRHCQLFCTVFPNVDTGARSLKTMRTCEQTPELGAVTPPSPATMLGEYVDGYYEIAPSPVAVLRCCSKWTILDGKGILHERQSNTQHGAATGHEKGHQQGA